MSAAEAKLAHPDAAGHIARRVLESVPRALQESA